MSVGNLGQWALPIGSLFIILNEPFLQRYYQIPYKRNFILVNIQICINMVYHL